MRIIQKMLNEEDCKRMYEIYIKEMALIEQCLLEKKAVGTMWKRIWLQKRKKK